MKISKINREDFFDRNKYKQDTVRFVEFLKFSKGELLFKE